MFSRGKLQDMHEHHPTPAPSGISPDRIVATARSLPRPLPVSHTSAWALHGLPVPDALADNTIHFTTTPDYRVKRQGVTCHRRPGPPHTTSVDGVNVTTIEQTWLDFAGLTRDVDVLVEAGDIALNAGCTAESLREVFTSGHRVNGRPAALEALDFIRPGVHSVHETRARLRLLAAGYPEPVTNHRPRLSDTRRIRFALAYPHPRIGLDIQLDDDPRRSHLRAEARAKGWTIITLGRTELCDDHDTWLTHLTRAAYPGNETSRPAPESARRMAGLPGTERLASSR